MYLKSIKLAGFKSFADPQTIRFEHPFTCIVGPNGCGKSNIIDAVKWVIGESSAKNLRGGQLTDVIFNGSTGRKPLGMAKVELVFDNSQGRLQGQWSSFKEISLGRVVYRDGQSNYFLNQTRCRRKDIIDLFLGTGLGPRSYAIIEQGMVNRFIDAKPAQMRAQIEEASGVSKYKEKRKETWSKLEETQENLERLEDLHREIEKRVQNLEKQSQQALVYQELKEQWASCRLELYGVLWQSSAKAFEESQTQLKTYKQEQDTHETSYQEFNARHGRLFLDLEQQEQAVYELEQNFQNTQLELKDHQLVWQKHRDRLEYLQQDNTRQGEVDQELQEQITSLRKDYEQRKSQTHLSESCQELKDVWQQSLESFTSAQTQYDKSQKDYESLLKMKQEPQSRADVIKTKVESLEQFIIDCQDSLKQAQAKHDDLQAQADSLTIESLKQQISSFDTEVKSLEKIILETKEGFEGSQNRLIDLKAEVAKTEQYLKISTESLAQQQRLLDNFDSKPWDLLENSGQSYKTLFKDYQPQSPESEHLVDVLGAYDVIALTKPLKIEDLSCNAPRPLQLCWEADTPSQKTFTCDFALPSYLERYQIVSSWDKVEQLAAQIDHTEVLVLPNGALLGKNWFQPKAQHSVKSRSRCQLDYQQALEDRSKYQQQLEELEDLIESSQCQLDSQQQCLIKQQASLTTMTKQRHQAQVEWEKALIQRQHIQERLEECTTGIEKKLADKTQARESIEQYREELTEVLALIDSQQAMLTQGEDVLEKKKKRLKECDEQRSLAQKAYHEQEKLYAEYTLQLEDLQRQIEQRVQDKERYVQRSQALEREINSLRPQIDSCDKAISESQDRLDKVTAELHQNREKLDDLQKKHGQIAKEKRHFEKKLSEGKDKIHQVEIEWEKNLVSQNHVKEQIFDLGLDFDTIKTVQVDESKDVLKERVQKLEKDIEKLGPINLNACAEYEQELEKATVLSCQCDDIAQSYDLLARAVEDLDKDIIKTYRNTFKALQESFAELFPKLFGGGQGELKEVAGDLEGEPGVIVFAQPPGKKNATLSALSGGEKALTAAALVLSFFKLNPAPFCLMDEIDAPLDDNNTSRLANMLDYLSQTVQCLCVTHSKITMQKGHTLYGVTMREPGVSRLVSVCLKKAQDIVS